MDPFDGSSTGRSRVGITGRAGSPTRTSRCLGGARRHLEGRRPRDAHLHRRHRRDPPGVLRGGQGRRRHRLAELPAHHRAAGPPRHHHRRHPLPHRRAAVVRPHLDDDQGGPGFTSDVVASVIYKQYQAGFFGLSTAGNVMLFLVVARSPRCRPGSTGGTRAVTTPPGPAWRYGGGLSRSSSLSSSSSCPSSSSCSRPRRRQESSLLGFTLPTQWVFLENLQRSFRRGTSCCFGPSRTARS